MEASKKLLTISIPTWNRSNYLKELLEQLTFQITAFQLESDIELLVSNNNSEDNTEELISLFTSKFQFISYNKNETNIGAKSNVIKSMELASSEFVMVLGDDDRVRKNCLVEIIDSLKSLKNVGVLIDICLSKEKDNFSKGEISLVNLIQNFYWYIGNAGLFILKTDFIKELRHKYDYNFFNECWPQTQCMILGVFQKPNYKCYISNLHIHSGSIHGDVMIYNSFYLWRTCYFELTNSINSIKGLISKEVYNAAKSYLQKSLPQQVFNILQCGVFVDNEKERKKTASHIFQNIRLYSLYEKWMLLFVIFVLSMPAWLSKPMSDISIFCLKGREGLNKKNNFVQKELLKKRNHLVNKNAIRALEFEK
ncbi:MAG TPA: glycosyltransferase family A protein [Bacteroidia bacterium]|nr:glycosyltransferase family A protein [Bacteroidia bacterium]HNU33858.1 glycosyltransferase family A protein [Bacteroidia bacterium]